MMQRSAADQMANYRAETASSNKAIITTATFICKKCKSKRDAFGRRELVPGLKRAGYICAGCVVTK